MTHPGKVAKHGDGVLNSTSEISTSDLKHSEAVGAKHRQTRLTSEAPMVLFPRSYIRVQVRGCLGSSIQAQKKELSGA